MPDAPRASSKPKHLFGGKLRTVRQRKAMTLKTVASAAGISEGLLSQIERNKVSPSIDTLLSIAEVLDIDLDYLFREVKRTKPVEVTRRGERATEREDGVVFHRLSRLTDTDRKHSIEAIYLEIEPGGSTGHGEYGHPGRELGYIEAGIAELEYGTETYRLRDGDCVSFSSDIPHTLRNPGDQPLRAVWVNTPPRAGRGAGYRMEES
ncbi:MAG: helix-turn-helix domain-containing protein [Spirochaetota bacterium]